MDSNTSAGSEQMKVFLQEGLSNYAPALVALSEFRRQIQATMLTVLGEFSASFSELGLSIENLKLVRANLDDQNLKANSFMVDLKKDYGGGLSAGYYVAWDSEKPAETQVQIAAWVYLGTRPNRDGLFAALTERRTLPNDTELEQNSYGTTVLVSFCNPVDFFAFGDSFRTVIEEWVDLLSAVGGVGPFLSAG